MARFARQTRRLTAAATRAQVALIEARKMGGDSLNTGRTPSNAGAIASAAGVIARRSRSSPWPRACGRIASPSLRSGSQ